MFKDPIDTLPTTRQQFIPSQDDFKQADGATADLYTHGSRADPRISAVLAHTDVIHSVGDTFWDHKVSSIRLQYPYEPIIYPDTEFDLSTVASIGQAEANENFDPLYIDIDRALTFQTSLYRLGDGYFRREEPIARSTGFQIQRAEPLLDFLGMSICRPHAIFPTADSYVPFIQDFHIYTQFKDMIKVANATPDFPLLTLELEPTRETVLQTRSQDGFDQTTKELQKVSMQHPLLERYTTTFQADPDVETAEQARIAKHHLDFETNSGPPDAVFLKLQRKVEKGTIYTINEPKITNVYLELFNQNVKSVSDLNPGQLYHAVRRNSNYRADTVHNIETEGCVLLTRSDFGNWSRWQQRLRFDNFKGRFIIQFESRSLDRTISNELNNELENQDLTFTVIFVYNDYSFVGTPFNNRFKII